MATMQAKIIEYFEACLIVNDRVWGTSHPFGNHVNYYVNGKGGGYVKFQFNDSYVTVQATITFPYSRAENASTGSVYIPYHEVMASYHITDEMSKLKEALMHIAKKVSK
jgi:hypothetical protein